MMKTLVIYKSSSGFTRRYAEWIAEELSADIYPISDITLPMMMEYECIVFGSHVHAVGIEGISLIKRNLEKLRGKRLIIFATGAAPSDEARLKKVRDMNLTIQQQANIKFFYLRGGFNYAALPFIDKMLMTFYKMSLIRKRKQGKHLTEDEIGILELLFKPEDFTRRENVKEIVKYALMGLAS